MTFGEVIFTIFMVFLWAGWLVVVISVLVDIFRSDDLSGWAKAGWTLLVVFATWLGVVIYLVVRGQGMNERRFAHAAALRHAHNQHHGVGTPSGAEQSTADKVAGLASQRDQGVLTDDEFQAQKARLLS